MKEWIKDNILGNGHYEKALQAFEDMETLLDKVSLNIVGYKVDEDIDYTIISRNFYSELINGISVRLINGPKDKKFDFEKPAAKFFGKIDFEKNSAIIMKFEQEAKLPSHYHNSKKKIICISGKFEDTISGKVCKAGEVMEIPGNTPHTFSALEKGMALIELGKISENTITFTPNGQEDKE